MTRRARTLDRLAVTSSVRPSAKYAFSGSVLRFVKGRTTIDVIRPAVTTARKAAEDPAAGARDPAARQASISDLYA